MDSDLVVILRHLHDTPEDCDEDNSGDPCWVRTILRISAGDREETYLRKP